MPTLMIINTIIRMVMLKLLMIVMTIDLSGAMMTTLMILIMMLILLGAPGATKRMGRITTLSPKTR